MGFLKRLFGTIEKVNKGEAPIEELDQALKKIVTAQILLRS